MDRPTGAGWDPGVLSVLPPLMEALGGVAIVGALWYGSGQIAAGRAPARSDDRAHDLRRSTVDPPLGPTDERRSARRPRGRRARRCA